MKGEHGVALRWLSIRSLTCEWDVHIYLSIQQEGSTMHLLSSSFVILGSIQIYRDCDIDCQPYLLRVRNSSTVVDPIHKTAPGEKCSLHLFLIPQSKYSPTAYVRCEGLGKITSYTLRLTLGRIQIVFSVPRRDDALVITSLRHVHRRRRLLASHGEWPTDSNAQLH